MRTKTKNKPTPLTPEMLDNIPRWTVTITDERTWLTRHDERGLPSASYPVRADDLASVFNRFQASTGLLADDVLFWQCVDGKERIGIWLPPQRRAISWRTGNKLTRFEAHLPGFVFVGQGGSYWLYAAQGRPAKNADPIYKAPLPNVHGDGLVCLGNVPFPKCSMGTIRQAAQLFWESEFNHDLSDNKVNAKGSLFNFFRNTATQQRDWWKRSAAFIQHGMVMNAMSGKSNSDWEYTSNPEDEDNDE